MSSNTQSRQSHENKYQSKVEELSRLEAEHLKAGNHLRYLQTLRMKEWYSKQASITNVSRETMK
jgi:hypothetical protein